MSSPASPPAFDTSTSRPQSQHHLLDDVPRSIRVPRHGLLQLCAREADGDDDQTAWVRPAVCYQGIRQRRRRGVLLSASIHRPYR